jgi:hypothetical protein
VVVEQHLQNLSDRLAGHRNADGGWGYAPQKASRIEPTCWSLLATSRASGQPIDLEVLLRWKRQDGWFIDVPGAPVNYAFNALAALTLWTRPEGAAHALRIASQLLEARGMKFPQGKEIRQDNSLQAWSWIDATFSWVEPTTMCVLLIKKLRAGLPPAAANDRIDIAERMLLDRACSAGGWNYGGSNVYGQELFPFVPTTALGLLAMQDRAKDPTVQRARQWLMKEALTEPSAQALSLALIALAVFRTPASALEQALRKHVADNASEASAIGSAMALYALSRSPNGASAFAL